MANYQNLKAAISAAIRTNGNQEITGQVLQDVLNSIVSVIGANYTFAGVATPATNPGTPDQNVIYLAMEGGTYTNFNGTVLPAGISLLMWNGSWTSETVMYGDGGVFDISVYKSSGGTLATFADLSAALDGGNNIPASSRKGGMSVKFVQSSDNKYVQARCMADEFTTDTTQWSIAEEGVYVDNPEFIYVKTDAEDKILWAIRTDGNIFYGAGVPPQIVNYINEKIAELSLDEYEDIVAFLNNLEKGDKILQDLLDEKVDKEEGKSLIDEEYANGIHYIENPEFVEVKLDSENKIIWAVKTDGGIYYGAGVPQQVIEYVNAALDTKVDKVTGKSLIDSKFASSQGVIQNPEYIKVYTDSDDNIIEGTKNDGTKFINGNVQIEGNTTIEGGIDIKKYINIDTRAKKTLFGEELIQDLSFKDGWITNNGNTGIYGSMPFITSYPFQVYKGDKLYIDIYGIKNFSILAKTFNTPDIETNYSGIQYTPIIVATQNGQVSIVYDVTETCKLAVCTVAGHNTSIKIYRNYLSKLSKKIIEESDTNYPFVVNLDFVPNLAKKRSNAILTYEADTKVSQNHISNAVAYPNGEIIAARDGGAVVKIDKQGNETTLLTISNSRDWRGVFIDSALNVYVSPHSTNTTPTVAQSDRGLYRLAYNGNSFEKVISLYYSPEECGVEISLYSRTTSFVVGNFYFYDTDGYIYLCTESHTKGTSFENDKFDIVDELWVKNTSYSKGDVRIYSDNYFVCHENHTSSNTFDYDKWIPATACMANDDTIWTMCEDDKGTLYAGVYAHSYRRNPAVYASTDGGLTWKYKYNFFTGASNRNSAIRHVHCINFNEYNNTLYAAVGELNTFFMSEDYNNSWVNLDIPMYYGQPTMLIGVKDGTLIGSDGHYACGVTKLLSDNKTIVNCGRTAPGFIFAMRRSDLTGWIYAFTRCDNVTGQLSECPPVEAINDPVALEDWKQNDADATWLARWEKYNEWASKYYPEDAIRPTHAVIMVSKDEGDTWEVIRYEQSSSNYASVCGFITTGYFRNGECLTGLLKSIENTQTGMAFVNPIVISEGKKKVTEDGYDLSDEIFINTNNSNIVTI